MTFLIIKTYDSKILEVLNYWSCYCQKDTKWQINKKEFIEGFDIRLLSSQLLTNKKIRIKFIRTTENMNTVYSVHGSKINIKQHRTVEKHWINVKTTVWRMKLKNKKAVRQDDLLLTTFSLLQLNGKKLLQNRVDVCLLLVDFIETFYQKPPTVFKSF